MIVSVVVARFFVDSFRVGNTFSNPNLVAADSFRKFSTTSLVKRFYIANFNRESTYVPISARSTSQKADLSFNE